MATKENLSIISMTRKLNIKESQKTNIQHATQLFHEVGGIMQNFIPSIGLEESPFTGLIATGGNIYDYFYQTIADYEQYELDISSVAEWKDEQTIRDRVLFVLNNLKGKFRTSSRLFCDYIDMYRMIATTVIDIDVKVKKIAKNLVLLTISVVEDRSNIQRDFLAEASTCRSVHRITTDELLEMQYDKSKIPTLISDNGLVDFLRVYLKSKEKPKAYNIDFGTWSDLEEIERLPDRPYYIDFASTYTTIAEVERQLRY